MKFIFSIFFAFCRPDEICDIVGECNVGVEKRLSAIEVKVENLETENHELKVDIGNLENQVENLETENDEQNVEIENLRNQVENLERENHELKNDVLELEKIVRPGKVPASCHEYADRGETKNGKYQIKPNLNIEPFDVTCDFRK